VKGPQSPVTTDSLKVDTLIISTFTLRAPHPHVPGLVIVRPLIFTEVKKIFSKR